MIYLTRHGQTEANVNHVWQGQSGNGSLNDKGREQANKLADFMSDKDIKKIVSSTLNRAFETATIVSKKINVELETDELLLEMNYGDFEGLSIEEVLEQHQELYNKWKEQPTNTLFPNGESFADLQMRAKKIISTYFDPTDNILLVSHEDTIRSIIVAVSGKTSEFWLPEITNTSITTFEYSDGKIVIKGIGETPHLS